MECRGFQRLSRSRGHIAMMTPWSCCLPALSTNSTDNVGRSVGCGLPAGGRAGGRTLFNSIQGLGLTASPSAPPCVPLCCQMEEVYSIAEEIREVTIYTAPPHDHHPGHLKAALSITRLPPVTAKGNDSTRKNERTADSKLSSPSTTIST